MDACPGPGEDVRFKLNNIEAGVKVEAGLSLYQF